MAKPVSARRTSRLARALTRSASVPCHSAEIFFAAVRNFFPERGLPAFLNLPARQSWTNFPTSASALPWLFWAWLASWQSSSLPRAPTTKQVSIARQVKPGFPAFFIFGPNLGLTVAGGKALFKRPLVTVDAGGCAESRQRCSGESVGQ